MSRMSLVDYPKTAEHPEFTLCLRLNFASGGVTDAFGVRFVGSEGVMNVGYSTLTVNRRPREAEPGYTINTFPKSVQDQFLKDYRAKFPELLRAPDLRVGSGVDDAKSITSADPGSTALTRKGVGSTVVF